MPISTKIRLTILASIVALTAAFAQAADQNYKPEGGTPDATVGKSAEGGAPDATPRHKARKAMHKKIHRKMHRKMHKHTAPSETTPPAVQEQPGVPKN